MAPQPGQLQRGMRGVQRPWRSARRWRARVTQIRTNLVGTPIRTVRQGATGLLIPRRHGIAVQRQRADIDRDAGLCPRSPPRMDDRSEQVPRALLDSATGEPAQPHVLFRGPQHGPARVDDDGRSARPAAVLRAPRSPIRTARRAPAADADRRGGAQLGPQQRWCRPALSPSPDSALVQAQRRFSVIPVRAPSSDRAAHRSGRTGWARLHAEQRPCCDATPAQRSGNGTPGDEWRAATSGADRPATPTQHGAQASDPNRTE